MALVEAPAAHVTGQRIGAGNGHASPSPSLGTLTWAVRGSCGLFKLAPEPERRHRRGPSGRGGGAADLRHRLLPRGGGAAGY